MANPASHPGARPPAGGRTPPRSAPLRVSTQEITEFEFHISPAPDSSRPQTGVGMVGRRSRIRCANATSSDTRTRAGDRVVGVGDPAVPPAADLVAEQPNAAGPSHAHRALRHDTALFTVEVRHRRLFDDVATFRHTDFQSRVVQVAPRSPLHQRRQRLEHLSAEPHDPSTRAQRDPVQIHRSRLVVDDRDVCHAHRTVATTVGARNLVPMPDSERNPHAGRPFTDDDAAIAAALEDVSVPALLCSLVHITGDPSWIRCDLRPAHRDAQRLPGRR